MVDTTTPGILVEVDGAARDVTSLRLQRALAWSPDGTDSGITAATGGVEWAADRDTATRAPNPWSPGSWPPAPGTPVTIDAGMDGVLTRQLVGVIDEASGAFGAGSVASDVVDLIDRLNVPVSRLARAEKLPTSQGTSYPGLTSHHLADDSMRRAGFYSTPPLSPGCVACIPLQGSAWPERGEWGGQVSAGTSSTSPPSWVVTPWGLAASDLTAIYSPQPPSGYEAMQIAEPRRFQVTVMVDPAQPGAGFSTVQARWGSSAWIGLSLGVAGGVFTARAVLVSGSTTFITTLPVESATTFSMVVWPDGTTTLYASDGRSSTSSVVLPAAFTNSPMSTFRVVVPSGGPPLGGAQAAFTSLPAATQWTPSARLSVSTRTLLVAAPAVEDTTALQLLRTQAQAEVAAMWIDETGVLQWMARDVLLSRPPVATLTAEQDLLDLHWESSVSTVRSSVRVSWKRPSMRITTLPTITLWQGRGDSMSSGDSSEDFIGPATDEEWFSIRTDPLLLSAAGGITALNEGQRTLSGGMLVQDGQSDVEATGSHITTTVTEIGRRRWLVESAAGSLPAGKNLTLRAPDYSTISPTRRGMDLPIVRGRGRARWVDQTRTGTTMGPANGPVLEHDAGLYAQSSGVAQTIANWISARVTTPAPMVTSLPVVPDLNRRLGDVVTIEDEARSGIRLTALVTSVDLRLDADPARITQTLGVHVISAEVPWLTLGEVEDGWAGTTLAALEAARTGDTLAQFDSDPLEGA